MKNLFEKFYRFVSNFLFGGKHTVHYWTNWSKQVKKQSMV